MDANHDHPPLALDTVRSMWLDGRTKGMPHLAEPFELGSIGRLGLSLENLPLPVMVLRASALEHNLSLMQTFCREHGVALAPHGKTTMAPQLWDRQLKAGAWGLTAATVAQARVMREVGVRRIMIANQLVDPSSIGWVAAQLDSPDVTLLCLVDSVNGVELLDAHLTAIEHERRLPVLVEMGHVGGRTGCRSVSEGVRVAIAARSSAHLELAGVEAFEGTVGSDRSPGVLEEIGALLDELAMLVTEVGAIGSFTHKDPMLISAGGSAFFDLVVDRLGGDRWGELPARLVLRPGCYLIHDHGFYGEVAPRVGPGVEPQGFVPALELCGAVLSRPEPNLAIVGFGKRDAPFDLGMPIPLVRRSRSGAIHDLDGVATIERMNDQHAYVRLDTDVPLEVGDVVRCGISHPCTAMDRWKVLSVIDDADRVIEAVATFF
jgi:D-serine dehydratase